MRIGVLSWALLGLFASSGGLARGSEKLEEISNIEELSLEGLLGTVSAASRTEESLLKSPAPVTVLDRQDIRASGAASLPELLRQVPGTQVMRTGPGDYIVSLRGAGGIVGNNLVVLLDGVPVASRVDGTVDWPGIPADLYNIERVEIVRGPVSAIYGANALTGVVAITTRRPGDRPLQGGARIGIGVDHEGKTSSIVSGWIGGKWRRLRVNATAHGLHDMNFAATGEDGEVAPAMWNVGANLHAELELGKDASLILNTGGSYRRRGEVDGLGLLSEPRTGGVSLVSLRFAARNLPSIFDTLDVWVRGKWLWGTPALQEGMGGEIGLARGTIRTMDGDAGLDLRLDLPKHLGVAAGGSAGLDRVNAPQLLHPLEDGRPRGRYGAYLALSADLLRRVHLSAVGRVDLSPRTDGPMFSGRISAIYYRDTYSLRFSVGRGFREPTYVEIAGRLLDRATGLILAEGNPAIRPPLLDTLELGTIVAPGPHLTFAVSLYLQRLERRIELSWSDLVDRGFYNDEESLVMLGGEVEARWRVNEHLTLLASLSGLWWMQSDPDSDELTGSPRQNSSILGWAGARTSFLSGRIGASAGVGYSAPRSYDTPAGIPPVLLDRQIGHQVRLEGAGDFQLSARVPVRGFFKLQAFLPHGVVESPFPGAGRLGSVVMLGAEYHAD